MIVVLAEGFFDAQTEWYVTSTVTLLITMGINFWLEQKNKSFLFFEVQAPGRHCLDLD